MGRNTAIRRFDAHPPGQPLDLFESAHGRAPVLMELLRSPWIRRASESSLDADGIAVKRVERPVEVDRDADRRVIRGFVDGGRRFEVESKVLVWTVERRWWDPERHVSRIFVRVVARHGGATGTYDLAYDRLARTWVLAGIAD